MPAFRFRNVYSELAEDGILEGLASDELDDLLGLDLDLLASRRIAAHARRTLDLLDLAEAREHIALFFLLRALDREVEETLVDGLSLLLADLAGFGERCDDSALGCRNDFFLSHFY